MEFSNRISGIKPSLIREILKATADPNIIPFAAGNPAPEAFPISQIAEISNKILTTNPITALQYNISEGYTPLRNYLQSYLSDNYEIEGNLPIITAGAQQAIALVSQIFLNDGDVVACESPSFVGALNTFKANGGKLKGVEMEKDGMNIDYLEKVLKKYNPRILYTIPTFQNPTGITTSYQKRKEIIRLCKKYNTLILEDNPYGDLRVNGKDIPTLKSMDNGVIYVGSFSKTFSPGMRLGFVSATNEIAEKLTVAKQTSDVHCNMWSQMVLYNFLLEYDLKSHINNLKQIYKNKILLIKEQMDLHFKGVEYDIPNGGFFIWCKMKNKSNVEKFAQKALENGVAIVPGAAFLPESGESDCFRLNFSTPDDAQIVKGIKILSQILEKGLF